jgi:hypothetical protein
MVDLLPIGRLTNPNPSGLELLGYSRSIKPPIFYLTEYSKSNLTVLFWTKDLYMPKLLTQNHWSQSYQSPSEGPALMHSQNSKPLSFNPSLLLTQLILSWKRTQLLGWVIGAAESLKPAKNSVNQRISSPLCISKCIYHNRF